MPDVENTDPLDALIAIEGDSNLGQLLTAVKIARRINAKDSFLEMDDLHALEDSISEIDRLACEICYEDFRGKMASLNSMAEADEL